MSKADQILEGDEFGVDAKLLCGFASRQSFIFECILHHAEAGDLEGVRKCVKHAQNSLFAIVLQTAERHACDATKTFDYWLDRTVPSAPEEKLSP